SRRAPSFRLCTRGDSPLPAVLPRGLFLLVVFGLLRPIAASSPRGSRRGASFWTGQRPHPIHFERKSCRLPRRSVDATFSDSSRLRGRGFCSFSMEGSGTISCAFFSVLFSTSFPVPRPVHRRSSLSERTRLQPRSLSAHGPVRVSPRALARRPF